MAGTGKLREMDQVFVSYSRKDADFVGELRPAIENAGIPVWVDRDCLVGGVEWIESLADAMDNCIAVVLVISPDSVKSRWVRKEISFAARRGINVIPLLYRDAVIPPMFDFMVGGAQRLDFTDGALDRAIQALTTSIELLKSTKPGQSEAALGARKDFDVYIEDVGDFLDKISPGLVWRFNRRNYTPLASTIFRTYVVAMTNPIASFLVNLAVFSVFAVALNLLFPYPHDFNDDVVVVLALAIVISLIQWLGLTFFRRFIKSQLPKVFPDLAFRPSPNVPNVLLDRWEESVKPIIWQLLDEPVGNWNDYLEERVKDEELVARVYLCSAILAGFVIPD